MIYLISDIKILYYKSPCKDLVYVIQNTLENDCRTLDCHGVTRNLCRNKPVGVFTFHRLLTFIPHSDFSDDKHTSLYPARKMCSFCYATDIKTTPLELYFIYLLTLPCLHVLFYIFYGNIAFLSAGRYENPKLTLFIHASVNLQLYYSTCFHYWIITYWNRYMSIS